MKKYYLSINQERGFSENVIDLSQYDIDSVISVELYDTIYGCLCSIGFNYYNDNRKLYLEDIILNSNNHP